jgi:sugar phosphate isomerase/epimerase
LKFGLNVPVEQAGAAARAGWDFTEDVVVDLLQAEVSDAAWRGIERARRSPLPIPAANRLLPPTLKVTGPNVDLATLRRYMSIIARRAQAIGMHILVFGSGPARSVPEGFDRARARDQILDFCRMAADLCGERDVTLVVEPMHRGESNIINGVGEATEYVRAVNHPNLQCLADSYHSWLEHEPIGDIERAMRSIRHVHVADVEGRRSPGETGKHDYRGFFAALRRGGYEGVITVESTDLQQLPDGAARVLEFLRAQWELAASA